MKKAEYSEAEILSLLAEQVKSRVSVTRFAESRGIHFVTFYAWRRKYAELSFKQSKEKTEKSTFLPVHIMPQKQKVRKDLKVLSVTKQESKYILKLKIKGASISFSNQVSSDFVTEVLRGIL
jgi:transposase-like protein